MAQSKPVFRSIPNMWTKRNPAGNSEGNGQKGWYRVACEYIYDKERILDVGCAAGKQHCHFYKKEPSRVVGVDISQRALDASKKIEPNHDFLLVDELNKEQKFDVVTAIDVIEQVEEDIDFLEFCLNMTDRMFFLSTPNSRFSGVGKFHCRSYDPFEFESLIRSVCSGHDITFCGWSAGNMLEYNTKRLHLIPTFKGEDKIHGVQLMGAFVWKKYHKENIF